MTWEPFVPWAPGLRDNQYLEGFFPVLYHKQRSDSTERPVRQARISLKDCGLRLMTSLSEAEWRSRFSTQGPNHLVFEQIPGKITSLQLNDKLGSTPEWPLLLWKLPSQKETGVRWASPPQVWRTELQSNTMLGSRVQRHRVPSPGDWTQPGTD